jgi:predicted DNA-binding transcriptional regulator AlpA
MKGKGQVPRLAEVIQDPSRASVIPPKMIAPLLTQISAAQSALAAQLLQVFELEETDRETRRFDRLLTVAEVAARLAVGKYWLYSRSDELPFTVRIGDRQLRFSEQGIERYLRRRQGIRRGR